MAEGLRGNILRFSYRFSYRIIFIKGYTMSVLERFLRYVKINTASSEDGDAVPSTEEQSGFARLLEREMKDIGMSDVFCDEHAYVYGFIPASPGLEHLSCIGFIAHLDTVPDFPGENVNPCVIPGYDGKDVPLGSSGRVLTKKENPELETLIGQTLITTDGTTVLGSDDKAGIAAIMDACEKLISGNVPHRRIAVCFTPDEEIGHGAALLDLDRFGAGFAFTVDGDDLCQINCETFNAAAASWEITGVSVHPGSAKDIMVNASLVAMEINSMLPGKEIPACTADHEGFFHLTEMSGGVDKASLEYIIRDHSASKLEERKKLMWDIEKTVNRKYGDGTARLSIKDQYRNMYEVLKDKPGILEIAENAVRSVGLEPVYVPVRGGTDGSQLSFRGLPCPNLGTGGFCFHGPYEHITSERLEQASDLVFAAMTTPGDGVRNI